VTSRRRLFVGLLRSTLAGFTAALLPLAVLDLVHDGFSWSTVRDMAGYPVAWIALSLPWAGWRTAVLARRARALGVEPTEKLLHAVQTHTVTGIPLDRIRAELGRTRRASDLTDGNPLRFRWHPYRTRAAVQGSVAYDTTSGEAHVEVRTVGNLEAGLFRGAAFTVLCQVTRTLEGR
jgi:hypothetical protein